MTPEPRTKNSLENGVRFIKGNPVGPPGDAAMNGTGAEEGAPEPEAPFSRKYRRTTLCFGSDGFAAEAEHN